MLKGVQKRSIVSEVRIIPIRPVDSLVALASCVIDGKFYIGSIGVHTKRSGGYRMTYPNKVSGKNSINIFHPITRELGDEIEKSIIHEYEQLITRDTL